MQGFTLSVVFPRKRRATKDSSVLAQSGVTVSQQTLIYTVLLRFDATHPLQLLWHFLLVGLKRL